MASRLREEAGALTACGIVRDAVATHVAVNTGARVSTRVPEARECRNAPRPILRGYGRQVLSLLPRREHARQEREEKRSVYEQCRDLGRTQQELYAPNNAAAAEGAVAESLWTPHHAC